MLTFDGLVIIHNGDWLVDRKKYRVYINSPHGSVTATPKKGFPGTVVTLTNEPDLGYDFSSYTVQGATLSGNTFVIDHQDVYVTGNFSLHDYTITVTQPSGGTISAPSTAHYGDTVTLTSIPSTGYELDYFIVDGQPIEGNTFVMPLHDVEISGVYNQLTYTITVNSGSHGTITAPTTAHYGDTITISATPDYGWLVDHYTVNGSTISGSSFTMPASNVTIGVTYKEDPNPLGLGPYTIRFQFENESYDPRNDHGDQPYPSTARWTQRSSSPNTWDFRYLNTNWSGMFSGDAFGDYERTGWVHVLGANLGAVTNMYQMLNNAGPIKTIAYFDTSKATNLQGAFRGLPNLQAIPKFDTSSATNMSYMIENDSSLTAIPLFNTSRATNVSYMCRSVGNCSGAYNLYHQMATQATPPANHAYCFTGCGSTADRNKIPQSWGGNAAG